jgi:prepilin-type N-terminal cleavage/methylation domain-containing protein
MLGDRKRLTLMSVITTSPLPEDSSSVRSRGIAFGKDKQGFTLMELVVVIGIILLILGFAAPGVMGILKGKKVEQAAAAVVDVLERTRMEAVAKNTYLWIGLANVKGDSSNSVSGQDELWILSFRSKMGEKRPSADGAIFLPNSALRRAEGVGMVPTGSLPTMISNQLPNAAKDFATEGSSKTSMKWAGAGSSGALEFSSLILFTPRGEALIENGDPSLPAPEAFLLIGLARTNRGAMAPNDQDVAVVQISGLTGRISTLRP